MHEAMAPAENAKTAITGSKPMKKRVNLFGIWLFQIYTP
jgi:hypothetical protein